MKRLCFYGAKLITSLFLISCIPQGNNPQSPYFKNKSLIQSPELSGDFGPQNQLASIDRVFSISKSPEAELSDLTTVSISGDSSFYIASKSGCDRKLKQQDKCFVRVKFKGKTLEGSPSGVKNSTLTIGSLEIPLLVNYSPIVSGDVSVSQGNSSIEESMDYQCLQDKCDLIFKYKNEAIIPQQVGSLVVPSGYMVLVNNCYQMLGPKKTCAIKLRLKNIQDLSIGEVALNVNGETISTSIRVIKELDSIPPEISTDVLNAVVFEGEYYLQGSYANLRLSLSDNRDVSKGLKYGYSDQSCTVPPFSWINTLISDNILEVNSLVPNQDNILYISAEDALYNRSCVPLTIKDLGALHVSIFINQPPGGGLSVDNNSPLYGGEVSITYNPPAGYELDSWNGECSEETSNVCVLSNLTDHKTVSINVDCASGYIWENDLCVENNWPRGSLGNLVINSGETVNIQAGVSYDYNSITINSGGVLNIQGKGVALLGAKENVVINGTITTARWTDCGGSFSVNDPEGTSYFSKSYTQSAGGRGANGAPGANGPSGTGGNSSCGWGGGGGGGGAANNGTYFGGAGGSGQANGAAGKNNVAGGAGGQSSTLAAVAATASSTSPGAIGRGGGGGGGAGGFFGNAGGGGGGGGKGSHANSLIIKSKGTVSGTGSINLSGTNGTNGGQGGKGYSTQATNPLPNACGGGGGGGAGGSGGDFRILSRGNTSNSISLNLTGGTRGNGGAGNSATNVLTSAAGSNGVDGVAGTYSSSNW